MKTLVFAFAWWSSAALAASTIVAEPDGAYHFVSSYRVVIDAPVTRVWRQLMDLKSWMYEFELEPLAGEPGRPGEVLRLYAGQDFAIQLLQVVPDETLVIANLPSDFRGEHSTGTGVITLHPVEQSTIVELVMSRRYAATGDGANETRARRESDDFRQVTDAMWRDRFLGRLKCLAESACTDAGGT